MTKEMASYKGVRGPKETLESLNHQNPVGQKKMQKKLCSWGVMEKSRHYGWRLYELFIFSWEQMINSQISAV